MRLVAIVTALALLEYAVFVWRAGQARGRHNVPAPSMTGHDEFERNLRVQENTIEQLVMFIPALWLFATYASETWAAGIGLVFIVGRALYARAYVHDPARRGPGFALSLGSNMILIVGGLIGAVLD